MHAAYPAYPIFLPLITEVIVLVKSTNSRQVPFSSTFPGLSTFLSSRLANTLIYVSFLKV